MLFLLGIVDLLVALSVLLGIFGFPFMPLQAGSALLLLGKGLVFISDPLSILDVVCALAAVFLLWTSVPWLAITVVCYLTIKGLYSFV
jgi:hypothetical protein